MLNKELLDKWLLRFRNLFRDHRSFINFKKIVYGFIAAFNINTLTAVVASLYLMARDYDRIDDYFKRGAFDLDQINQLMIELIAKEAPLSKVNNRILLCGDATKIPKQAKKDPTVDKSYIQSESVNKRTGYVPTSVFGCLSTVCEVGSVVFSMLLLARIVEHNEEIEAWQGRKRDPQTVRIIKDAVKVLKTMDQDAYIALDRYYLSSSLLDELESYN